eukprot:4436065-Ditylum_brightwellii.AAC.1
MVSQKNRYNDAHKVYLEPTKDRARVTEQDRPKIAKQYTTMFTKKDRPWVTQHKRPRVTHQHRSRDIQYNRPRVT